MKTMRERWEEFVEEEWPGTDPDSDSLSEQRNTYLEGAATAFLALAHKINPTVAESLAVTLELDALDEAIVDFVEEAISKGSNEDNG